MINKQTIIDKIAASRFSPFAANESGLISSFGVLLTKLPTQFYVNFSERLTHSLHPDMIQTAEHLLIHAAHECGYHTGNGLLCSRYWLQEIAPLIEEDERSITNRQEPTLEALFSIIGCLGWGQLAIIELKPGIQLIVRATHYYEADSVLFGRCERGRAYMLQGVCAGFMDLIYGPAFPEGLNTFVCQQTKGLECGDDYAEFLVSRR